MNNILDLTQKLHDLIHCREPNPFWESKKSRASMYFRGEEPTGSQARSLADITAKEISDILQSLPADSPYRSQCEHALRHCGYEALITEAYAGASPPLGTEAH